MAEEKKISEDPDVIQFEVEFAVPEDMPTFYANEMGVQVMHSEFILSFFEIRTPLLLKKPTEPQKAFAKCVGRFAIPFNKIPAFIEALDKKFISHLKQLELQEEFAEQQNISKETK